jgi:RNA 3'-terminal phosphate cyclase
LAAGGGRVKLGAASVAEEQQQQLRKHSGIKQRQGIGKGVSAEGTVGKRQSSADQPTARSAHEPCVETADRRGRQLQQQPPVGSALSNTGAFLLLSQVNWS